MVFIFIWAQIKIKQYCYYSWLTHVGIIIRQLLQSNSFAKLSLCSRFFKTIENYFSFLFIDENKHHVGGWRSCLSIDRIASWHATSFTWELSIFNNNSMPQLIYTTKLEIFVTYAPMQLIFLSWWHNTYSK